jgi:hypothetical protein
MTATPLNKGRAAVCGVLAVMALGASLALSAPARAATTSNLGPLSMGYGQTLWNYDFTTNPGAWNHVDWAVSVLFYNNAEIDKVKNAFGGAYWIAGGRMYAYLNNGGGGLYDQDSGRKTDTPSCLGSTRHYREYAPPSTDRMGYNPSFGYYTFATTHYDHHELCNDWYDDSEGTELSLYNRSRDKGWAAYHDYSYFSNYEWRDEGNHHWRNNGYATYIRVP